MTIWPHPVEPATSLSIAVIGSGISGLAAAWLLAQRHRVTLLEADCRIGGHSHTVDVGQGDLDKVPVDTGFIVYNEQTYPNLAALFRHLGVPTKASDMSFSVSLDEGRLEYSGTDIAGLFAQRRNLANPRFWSMLRDIVRFYSRAPRDAARIGFATLADYLDAEGYGVAFREDHLYPMAAAIWSTPSADIGAYPAQAFIRFCDNHGLLKIMGRPIWRTVEGGSRAYVERLLQALPGKVRSGCAVRSIRRERGGVEVADASGQSGRFDQAVIACHADQALDLIADPSPQERRLLGAFGYSSNEAVLHRDPLVMPRRRGVWSSWNYTSLLEEDRKRLSVTYWMNRLQSIPRPENLFVTLNPAREPRAGSVIRRETYRHPQFNAAAIAAQERLWSIQGLRNTWFCGAYFGAGFHEDGLQAGLAVAECIGGVRRPWTVAAESGRIRIGRPAEPALTWEPA